MTIFKVFSNCTTAKIPEGHNLPGRKFNNALIDLAVWVPGIDSESVFARFNWNGSVKSIDVCMSHLLAIDIRLHGNDWQRRGVCGGMDCDGERHNGTWYRGADAYARSWVSAGGSRGGVFEEQKLVAI